MDTQLTPSMDIDHGPEMLNITDQEALEYVIDLLDELVRIHEEEHNSKSDQTRRPSYDEVLLSSSRIVELLSPKKDLFTDLNHNTHAIDNDKHNAEEMYKRFWLKESPPITVRNYLQRFHRYCRSSPATYLTAGCLIYLVSVELKLIPITQRNVHRLFSAAFIISAKFIEDKLYSMNRYATTAGLKKNELVKLELSFLLLINFSIKADREALRANLRNWARLKNEHADTQILA